MRELLKNVILFVLEVLKDYPLMTGMLFLFIGIYMGFIILPKKRTPKFEVKDYGYYADLHLTLGFTLFCLIIFIVQMFRLF